PWDSVIASKPQSSRGNFMIHVRRTLLLALASATIALLFGQSERGTITGTVADPSGAIVPGARVVVTNLSTKLVSESKSNDAGGHTAASLPVGPYRVRVEKEGFRPVVRWGIELNAASTVRVDVTLEVGTAVETVEVSASAQLLSTESAKTSVT